jgi:hypothetical protein
MPDENNQLATAAAAVNWASYLYKYDFTRYFDALSVMPDGALSEDDAVLLGTIIAELDTGEGREFWNANPESDAWSLARAKVVHNGANSRAFPTKYKYQRVLVLEFDELSVKPQKRIYLQYNEPAAGNA